MTVKKSKSPTTIKDLKPAGYNPRTISNTQLKSLSTSLRRWGDLSGVCFNRASGMLISGHQRIKTCEGLQTKLVKKECAKDKTGTVATGYILVKQDNGTTTRIPYREVDWSDKHQEMAANVAANASGGTFDQAKLGKIVAELQKGQFGIEALNIDKLMAAKALLKHKQATAVDTGKVQEHNAKAFETVDLDVKQINIVCPKCGYGWHDSRKQTVSPKKLKLFAEKHKVPSKVMTALKALLESV